MANVREEAMASERRLNDGGHVGRFDEFAPLKRSIADLAAMIVARHSPPDRAKDMETVKEWDGFVLGRYRLCCRTLDADCDDMGHPDAGNFHDADIASMVARFGVVDAATGRPMAVFRVIDDGRGAGPEIADVLVSNEVRLSPEDMLQVLRELGLPVSRNNGADKVLAEAHDCWFRDGQWETREAVELLAVTFERICFCVSPVIRETVDVFVLPDPEQPLDGAGAADAAYWARSRYVEDAFERLADMETGTRPGFSSWMSSGEPRPVKVVGGGLDGEIARLRQKAGETAVPEEGEISPRL